MRVVRRAVLVVVLLLAALSQASAATAATERPEDFMRRVFRLTVDHRYGEAWQLLHPGHQRIAARQLFARCRREPPGAPRYRLVSARFVGKRYERIDVPLVRQRTSTAVTLRIVLGLGERTGPPEDVTLHAVWIDTRWAWVLPAADVPAFRAGRCPGT